MATSITASTTSPFNSLLLQDLAFSATGSVPGVSGVLNFNSANPYPTTANVIVNFGFTALTTTSNSLGPTASLQESADNSTWTTVAIFAPQYQADNGSTSGSAATNTQVVLGPNAKQYLRLSASLAGPGVGSGGVTGSSLLFVDF